MPKDPVTVGPEKHEVLLQKRPMFSGHAPRLGCLCAGSDPDRDIDSDVYVLDSDVYVLVALCFQGTRSEIYGYIDAHIQKLR